ncbi:MAG: hypothetical protein GY702_07160 [Desulfobulbaceae bacterium]|nr:hypothetical protein [Desulfobulbaceae bacterium]
MKTDTTKSKGGLFSKLRNKMSGKKVEGETKQEQQVTDETLQMVKEFEAVKKNPGHLTGWDFDRAFDFIERYPESGEAEILIGQMYATSGQLLKGLSYASAVKVIERMPGHAGIDSIVSGMYKLERDYIEELRSDVIAAMLKVIPDHPLASELTTALAKKNLTNAYDFVTGNSDNAYTKDIIKAMFDRDPNISVLLLQEKMDHPNVASIFDGIYGITDDSDIKKLTPNAIIFILDVAPDHPRALAMIDVLVEDNYVKAYDFAKMHPDHALVEEMKKVIVVRKPELEKLFNEA